MKSLHTWMVTRQHGDTSIIGSRDGKSLTTSTIVSVRHEGEWGHEVVTTYSGSQYECVGQPYEHQETVWKVKTVRETLLNHGGYHCETCRVTYNAPTCPHHSDDQY